MQKVLKLKSDEEALKLFGNLDENITFAEEKFNINVCARGHKLTITGESKNVSNAQIFFQNMLRAIRRGESVAFNNLSNFLSDNWRHKDKKQKDVHREEAVFVTFKGKVINPRSEGQKNFITYAKHHDIIFCIGPAGTGKTYLAVAIALNYLKQRRVSRIILTRPAIEAGESLGYLPGDMYAKINPYLRPLYDALYEMIGFDEVAQNIEKGIIEIAPLAYMRGRTLNDSFIILDEAQNSNPLQMKMFLTRLGLSSQCIITGDITQIDLPYKDQSGLVQVQSILNKISGIKFVYLTESDVVRHKLVKDIIKAYEKENKRRKKEKN